MTSEREIAKRLNFPHGPGPEAAPSEDAPSVEQLQRQIAWYQGHGHQNSCPLHERHCECGLVSVLEVPDYAAMREEIERLKAKHAATHDELNDAEALAMTRDGEIARLKGRDLQDAIRLAINRFSAENGSNTADAILAEYLITCLKAFDTATLKREVWYGHHHGVAGKTWVPEHDHRLPIFE